MLELEVPLSPEGWDEERQMFVEPKVQVLRLEHSLVSISKWEANWCKPFLSNTEMTFEETIDYIKCMTLTPNVDKDVYKHLTSANIDQIKKYIERPMTATTFSGPAKSGSNGELVTSELIYYWMIALQIPIDECQKWHLNRLLTLIRVCNVKNAPSKKMSKREISSRNASINAARRKRLGTKG